MANDGGVNSHTLTPLPADHRIGLIAASVLGGLSFLSTTALFLHLTTRLVRWKLAGPPPAEPPEDPRAEDARSLRRDSRGAADQYFAPPPPVDAEEMGLRCRRARGKTYPNQFLFLVYNLLLAEMQQSLAHILSATWVRRDGIFVGTSMWVMLFLSSSVLPPPPEDGWLISTGDLSCCAFTVGIALHTFLFLVYNYKAPQRMLYTVTLCLWLFVYIVPLAGILRTGNGRDVGGFYVRAIAWCWINESLRNYRLWTRYFWLFFCLLFTCVGYICVFFYVKGAEQGVCCAHGSRILGRITDRNAGYHPGFLLYPVIYVLCAAPLAICRVISMSGKTVEDHYFCFAAAMMASNGWMHVLLFSLTRGSILFYSSPAMVDIGLETFSFMRTPRRRFGNMVWVQGGLPPGRGESQDEGARCSRRKSITSPLLHWKPRRSMGTGEGILEMRHNEIAIQVDTVTRVEVEYT